MGPSPIPSVIHTGTIGTVFSFNSGNNGHGLKALRLNRPQIKMNIDRMSEVCEAHVDSVCVSF